MTALHEEYRPCTWGDVAGQEAAVASIRRVLARGWGGRAWWITGASGTGKTTLAKLIAAEGPRIDLATLTDEQAREFDSAHGNTEED